jgi:hypothetical protein
MIAVEVTTMTPPIEVAQASMYWQSDGSPEILLKEAYVFDRTSSVLISR